MVGDFLLVGETYSGFPLPLSPPDKTHAKSPCDGIGGTIQHLVSRANLQVNKKGQLLTPMQLDC